MLSISSLAAKLEYDKVLERVARFAISDGGKRRILSIAPSADRAEIISELQRVSETKELVLAEGSVPLDGIRDIQIALKKTTVENQALSVQELIDVASTLRASRSMQGFLGKRRQLYPALAHFPDTLFADKVVEFNISEALDDRGFVKDSASKELRSIRQGIIAAGDALRKKLAAIMHSVSDESWLQEEIITTRDGRLVIPVKTEFKYRVEGFIHSTSASGATVYIEPTESLDLNNTLRELQLREQREIFRILQDLTKQIVEIREPLERSLFTLYEIDALVAKARSSIELIGVAPTIADHPILKLKNARHPILLQRHQREAVIPLTLELGEEHRTLVITGPNAGGKTVALKTAGLLALCAQAGLHIPAESDSEVFPFTNYFVDIGDDQSIEND
ncbi:MAG: endonuclease MutS2, partial [Ignavibacteriales bacterium]|nr:endonuclease MutS2 [Ignavibacteriales bacterium]